MNPASAGDARPPPAGCARHPPTPVAASSGAHPIATVTLQPYQRCQDRQANHSAEIAWFDLDQIRIELQPLSWQAFAEASPNRVLAPLTHSSRLHSDGIGIFPDELWGLIPYTRFGIRPLPILPMKGKNFLYSTSNRPAAPMPPPTHIVTMTYFAPRFLPSISAWPVMRAPDMP